ncbi:MAG TPA: DUF177 domain-containing protein [Hyphomicrobium sp.]|nr:DUF177 domain-containing protein [Hyphomicrobium sp.]
MTTPLADWSHAITEIPLQGLSRERRATGDALASLATELGMLELSTVTAHYRIDRLAGGGYRLHGAAAADGAQACVVTVEPVPAHIEDTFDVEFWPDLPEADGGEDKSVLDERDVEALEGGSIPVGRIVFETISAGLDPYPRKPDAEFSWADKAPPEQQNVSPFAALSKLKNKP